MKDKNLSYVNPHETAPFGSTGKKPKRPVSSKQIFEEARQVAIQRQQDAEDAAYEQRLAEK